jgi:hypothetical protein
LRLAPEKENLALDQESKPHPLPTCPYIVLGDRLQATAAESAINRKNRRSAGPVASIATGTAITVFHRPTVSAVAR